MRVWVHVCSHTCGIWKQMSGLSHHCSPSCLLSQGLPLIPVPTDCFRTQPVLLSPTLGYRWAPACLAFSRGSRIWTPILMPVWQALRWLSHLPCPSFIVFLWFWSTFFTMGVAFVEQFANPFLGLHKILILLLFWVPLLSRAQDILFTSRGLFFLKGLLHFCALDQLFQDLQGWIMSCLCPAEAQFISTVLKYISGIRSQNSSHYVQIPQNTDLVFSN